MTPLSPSVPLALNGHLQTNRQDGVYRPALLKERALTLSVQVLQEFYVQATRATRPDAMTHRDAMSFVTSLQRFRVTAQKPL